MSNKQKQISKAFKSIRKNIDAESPADMRRIIKDWIESNLKEAKQTGNIEFCFHFDDFDEEEMPSIFFCEHEEDYYWEYRITRTEVDYERRKKVADIFVFVLAEDLCVKCDHPWPKA